MGLIFFLSAQPHVPGPSQPILDLILKKGSHFAGYGMLAVLWGRAFAGAGPGKEGMITGDGDGLMPPLSGASRKLLLLAWGVTVIYAISDEYHQSFVPGRHPGWADVAIDSLGAATALVFVTQAKGFFDLGNRGS